MVDDRSPSRDAAVETELASMVDVYGLSVLNQPEQIRKILEHACPGEQRHIDALMIAVRAEIPQRLRVARADERLAGLLKQSVRQIQQQDVLDPEWATWAVRAWAHALALPTTSLAPVASRPVADALTPTGVIDPAVRSPLFRDPTESEVERLQMEDDRREPVLAAPPMADEPDVEPLTSATAPDLPAANPAPFVAATEQPDPVVFPWEAKETARSGNGGRNLAIVVTLVVLAIAALAVFLVERENDEAERVAAARVVPLEPAPPIATPAPEPVAPPVAAVEPVTPPPAPPEPVTPPAIPAEPVPAAGDATSTTAPVAETPAPAPTPEPEPAPAGAVPTPAAPAAERADAARPVIERIDVPRVVEGAPFTVAIRLAGGARNVVAIERRFVDASGRWPRPGAVSQANGLKRSGNALLVPFRAMDAPARATVEFVAVGADGSRSAPKRAALAVAPPRSVARPVACAYAATCGTVLVARPLDAQDGSGPSIYQIVARMDDSTTNTSTAPYRLPAGSRVRLVGGRLVPISTNGR